MIDNFPSLLLPLIGPADGSSRGVEGGYSNDAGDGGGETNYGITFAVARANGYQGPMRTLPRDTAVSIYRALYWTKPGFDKLDAACPALAAKLFDIGVNMGPATGIKYLQRALNALNTGGSDYPSLIVDGGIGPASLLALRSVMLKRSLEGQRVLLGMVSAQQSVRYVEIAEGDPSQRKFMFGWQSQRALNGPV